MPLHLTIIAKGQVTLRKAVLDHLSINVEVSFLPEGRIKLGAADSASALQGYAVRSGGRGSPGCRLPRCRRQSSAERVSEDRPRYRMLVRFWGDEPRATLAAEVVG